LLFLRGHLVIRYQDIFVPGGFPRHTYNPRETLKLEARLQECTENLCKLVTVTGHTKSGKTVLCRKILPQEGSIWIDGGAVSEERDFWDSVVAEMDLFQSEDVQNSHETSSTIGAKGEAGADFLVVKGKGELSSSRQDARGAASTRSRVVSSRVTALKGLAASQIPVVIDDFHYLPRELQGSIVRALKPLIFNGLPVVLIAIPHRRYDAMKVEREMTGRIVPIDIPVWTMAELEFIPKTGFNLLNRPLTADVCERLSQEAIGSPHLMQDFCRAISRVKSVRQAAGREQLIASSDEIEGVFREVAENIGRPIFEKLARGPRQRSDRVERKLKNGQGVDIYELVLHALAHMRPGLVSLEYEDLRTAIREVSAAQIPQLHEVARVLKHMATIAASDQSSTPVIDFEEVDKQLHITDPFFAFYLRWGDLNH
jgi:hypothetical protein